jgi:hypothetical protein
MGRFKPNNEEMALAETLVRKVIQLNTEGLVNPYLEIGEYGLGLCIILPNEPQISWNRCEMASTEKELRDMHDWLLEQEMKARETK